MLEYKPKSIKTVGLIVTVTSGLIIFSNGMGAFAAFLVGFTENIESKTLKEITTPIEFIFAHYLKMCFFMITVGVVYLFGGVFIQKYKLWANRLVSVITVLIIILVWAMMPIIRSSTMQEPGLEILKIATILVAIGWTIPFILLVWYLNKKGIIEYFE